MPAIVPLDPATYRRHLVHGEGRIWAETNCYSDVVIELLHGLGFEPLAVLPYTVAIDFDLDQWTFFKPPPEDVAALYGLQTCELAPWRPLVEHLVEFVAAGRPVLVELDSFFLPDTAGTAYRRAHVKTTVAVNEIDPGARRLGYFHNQGYHALEGEDFDEILGCGGPAHPRVLPPYGEFLKPLPGEPPLQGPALVQGSLDLLRRHLARAPRRNPFTAFRTRFEADLPALLAGPIDGFHTYSFATMRQYGACFELAASGLGWLQDQGVAGLGPAAGHLGALAAGTKAFQFQLARAIARGRPLDLAPLDEAGRLWSEAMDGLRRALP